MKWRFVSTALLMSSTLTTRAFAATESVAISVVCGAKSTA